MTSSAYESGYDAHPGHKKTTVAHHHRLHLRVFGKTAIGLFSDAVHHSKDNSKSESDSAPAPANHERQDLPIEPESPAGQGEAAAVVPADQADQRMATAQARPAHERESTSELGSLAGDTPRQSQDPTPSLRDSQLPPPADSGELDEQDWTLDEVVASDDESYEEEPRPQPDGDVAVSSPQPDLLAPPELAKPRRKPSVTIVNPPPAQGPIPPLRFPVIVPQRRPGARTHGFVRAYAPVLAESDISREVFLQFLHDLHRAAQSEPVFDVVRLAAGSGGVANTSDPIAAVAPQAVQIATATATAAAAAVGGPEPKERSETNKFMGRANREIFEPRGLFALIVSYKKEEQDRAAPKVSHTTVNMAAQAAAAAAAAAKHDRTSVPEPSEENEGIAQNTSDTAELEETLKQRLRLSSLSDGPQAEKEEIPVMCAPLIFPALEDAASKLTRNDGRENTIATRIRTKAQGAYGLVADYFDRRAQAFYAFENPDSSTQPSQPQFVSRYREPVPSNAPSSRHFFTKLGGKFKVESHASKRKYDKKTQRKEAEKRAMSLRQKPRRRMLREDVLYLLVVNMPTEAELEAARARDGDGGSKDGGEQQ